MQLCTRMVSYWGLQSTSLQCSCLVAKSIAKDCDPRYGRATGMCSDHRQVTSQFLYASRQTSVGPHKRSSNSTAQGALVNRHHKYMLLFYLLNSHWSDTKIMLPQEQHIPAWQQSSSALLFMLFRLECERTEALAEAKPLIAGGYIG